MDSLTSQLPSTLLARTRRGRPPRPPELHPDSVTFHSRSGRRAVTASHEPHRRARAVPGARSAVSRNADFYRPWPRNQLLLARQHPRTKRIHVEPSCARLSENPVRSLLFFVDMVLDLLGQHLDLGVVKFLVGTARLKFSYKHLRT